MSYRRKSIRRRLSARSKSTRRRRLSAVGAICVGMSACGVAPVIPEPEPFTVTVCAIDITGSMRPALRQAARGVCVHEVETAGPGIVSVRIIDGESALNEAEVTRVFVPPDADCANPFAPRCARERRDRVKALVEARREAVTRIEAIPVRAVGSTDLVGLLAAASATLDAATAGPGAHRRLVIVSDYTDTTGREARLDAGALRDVEVVAHYQSPASPEVGRRRLEAFQALLTAAGVRSVAYIPLTGHPTL